MRTGMRKRIRQATESNGGKTVDAGENTVRKIRAMVTGVEGEVHIDKVEPLEGGVGGGGAGGAGGQLGNNGGNDNNYVRALYSQVVGMRRENQEQIQQLREEVIRLSNRNFQQQQLINRSVRQIALQPVQCPRNQQPPGGAAAIEPPAGAGVLVANAATLSRNPRTLYLLWHEFEFGIGGRKAAREFTAVERGRAKYAYHRQKVVWDKIAEKIRAGWTANTAIDAIYNHYGRGTSVTIIINTMRRDRIGGVGL